eukprot:5984718-Alexandrium_andersonii.AAC.1
MSASLVGSEMCIRDRGGGSDSSEPPASLARPWTPTPPPSAPTSAALPESCLLYTSDAADDM